jgi:hypothetical protein
MLSFTVPHERFEAVAWQRSQIAERRSSFHPIQLQPSEHLKSRECLDPFPSGEVSGSLIPIADDHVVPKVHEVRVTSGVHRHHTANGPGQRLINVFAEGSLYGLVCQQPPQ